MSTTFTSSCKVWLSNSGTSERDVRAHIQSGQLDRAVNTLIFYQVDSGPASWTEVGIAEITITLRPSSDINEEQLQSLQRELQTVRAENQQRENAILQRISKLQAIEYTPEAA